MDSLPRSASVVSEPLSGARNGHAIGSRLSTALKNVSQANYLSMAGVWLNFSQLRYINEIDLLHPIQRTVIGI